MGTNGWITLAAFVASGCSAANPLFNAADDGAVADTGAIGMETGGDGSTGEDDGGGATSGDPGTTGDQDPEVLPSCRPEVSALIDGCLHAAELSGPVLAVPGQYWREPTRDVLLPLACMDGYGEFDGLSSAAYFDALAPGFTRAPDAYFDALCGGGGGPPYCAEGLDAFEDGVLADCFADYEQPLALEPHVPADLELRTAIEQQIQSFENHPDERNMAVLEYAPGMTPTAAGDAIRKLMENFSYPPLGNESILRFDDGLYEDDPTFQPWLDNVRDLLGFEYRTWIVVAYHDIDMDDTVCAEQTRAIVAVQHQQRLVIKMVFPECTIE